MYRPIRMVKYKYSDKIRAAMQKSKKNKSIKKNMATFEKHWPKGKGKAKAKPKKLSRRARRDAQNLRHCKVPTKYFRSTTSKRLGHCVNKPNRKKKHCGKGPCKKKK